MAAFAGASAANIAEFPPPTRGGGWKEAAGKDWHALLHAPPAVRSDPEVLLAALPQTAEVLKCASLGLRSDPAFLRQVLRVHGLALEHCSEAVQGHRDLVLEAIQQNPRALRFASAKLRADPEVVLAAVRGGQPWVSAGSSAVKCAAEELNADIETVRDAMHKLDPVAWKAKVGRDWQRLADAPPSVRGDSEVVMQAVQDSFGLALPFATASLLDNKDVVMAAVRWWGQGLQHASETLRGDTEVVLEAVVQDWQAIQFATEGPRSSPEVVNAALQQSGEALQYASGELRNSRELALEAVKLDGNTLRYLDEGLRKDPELALQAVKENWAALRHVNEGMLNRDEETSHEIMSAAFESVETRRLWGGRKYM